MQSKEIIYINNKIVTSRNIPWKVSGVNSVIVEGNEGTTYTFHVQTNTNANTFEIEIDEGKNDNSKEYCYTYFDFTNDYAFARVDVNYIDEN